MLRECAEGGYRFLPGIRAFSSGVIAAPGWEIIHATLAVPVPWREGFVRIDRHLGQQGRPRQALCGVELRCPAPFSFNGFDAFNEGYRALLDDWRLLVAGDNPIPRTNVAPLLAAPAEPVLYGFAYTVAGPTPTPTFVVAGAGELRDRAREAAGIVRHGETTAPAMQEKTKFVMGVMADRLRGLGAAWSQVTTIDVYTAEALDRNLLDMILRPAGAAAIHGVRWFPSRPPIEGLEFEVDMRGVAREIVL